jgi:hypothetical protein
MGVATGRFGPTLVSGIREVRLSIVTSPEQMNVYFQKLGRPYIPVYGDTKTDLSWRPVGRQFWRYGGNRLYCKSRL